MLGKLKVVVVSCVAVGVLALGTASASATDFDVTNGGIFSLDAGASRLAISGAAAPINCSSTSASLEFAAGTYAFIAVIGTVTPQFSDCIGPVALDFTITCDPAYVAVGALTTPGASGLVADIYCEVGFPTTGCTAILEGSTGMEYVNPVWPWNGRLIVPVVGQSLNITSSQCSSILPVAAATLSGMDYELDPASAPHPEIH